MHDHPPAPKRASWIWPLIAAGMVSLGALVLCAVGALAVSDENYDGMSSWIDPVAAGSCCGAVGLLMIAPLAGWLVHRAVRVR